MKKENMLAAMMFGGQAGGGGGGSSDVLDVVCTATNNSGTVSYSYSHTAEEAWAAINGGKIVELKIRGTSGEILNTVATPTDTTMIFTIVGARFEWPNHSTQFILHDTYWEELLSNIDHSQYILPFFADSPNNPAILKEYNVPMYIGSDNFVGFRPIGQFIDFGSTIQALIMGAYSYVGTAIGTTITDADTLAMLYEGVVAPIARNITANRPVIISLTTGLGIVAKAMLNDVRYENDVVTAFSFAFTDFVYSSGIPNNLLRYNLSVSLVYSNTDELSSASAVALCTSDAITFM